MAQPPNLPLDEVFDSDGLPIIQYATPIQFAPTAEAFREGALLVVPRDGLLPARCVKCNVEASPKFTSYKKLYWHHPLVYLALIPSVTLVFAIPSLILYALIVAVSRKTTKVAPGLCAVHGSSYRMRILFGLALAIGGVALIIGGGYVEGDRYPRRSAQDVAETLMLVGAALFVISLFWLNFAIRVVWPVKIDNRYVWLKGAGPEFLNSLPATGTE